ncbi:hypothetical protein SAMN05192563_102450 [Paraburkholderia aspalathi]|uniref:Uncharacterized protein n=2 Tax=Paraburkholderia aspalathi TaxID=1324617 RepID=A0A1I7EJ62_9BURK|nr:hypothetical protein SAMN05192563_102450 [Paraburkholderia aspalathi]
MSISVPAGIQRELAEQFGRYFEARRIPFVVSSAGKGGLVFSFIRDNHEVPVAVSFAPGLLDEIEGLDINGQRAALANMYSAFAQALDRPGTDAALAAALHMDHFR